MTNTNVLRIGVLGSFTINGAPSELMPAQSQLMLALALGGTEGVSNGQLRYLLGADEDHPRLPDALRQLIMRTRRQLGAAEDGLDWILHLGKGHYVLHTDVLFDWDEFDDLADHGIERRDVACLKAAMSLVRGRPFADCYHWWLEDAFTEVVRSRIVETAELLADLELQAGEPRASARAAAAGLKADDTAETLWRAVMRAEYDMGSLAGLEHAWERCRALAAEISADGQPHPDTTELYFSLTSGSLQPV